MRYLLILPIILIALCISTAQQASVIIEDIAETDIYVKAEAIPTQVKSGRTLDIIFEIQNKRSDSINDVDFLAYDQCIFSGENSKTFSEIKPNITREWAWKWQTGSVSFERDCKISFKIDYTANFSRTQTISTLTETEYNQRDAAGTLSSISTSTDSSSNPIGIIFSFSESLPFMENDKISFFIDYVNKEKGFIDKFEPGDIKIKVTRNMENIDCNDYDLEGDELVLNRNLKFISGRAPRSTCTFTAAVPTMSPVDVQILSLIAKYKYSLDYSLSVKVLPK